jgi:hypothetical protein
VNSTESSKTADNEVYGPVTGGFCFVIQRNVPQCEPEINRSKTTGMELQNGNSATAQNKIQTNHDEDIETEIGKQIKKQCKNTSKEHHAEKGSK